MFKEMFLNETLENLEGIEKEIEEALIIEADKPFGDIKKGAFKKWCRQQGLMDKNSDDVPCKCICAGKKSSNPHVVKMASFADGIGGNDCGCKKSEKSEKSKKSKED